MEIEFDPAKDEANLAKHGVSLSAAALLDIQLIRRNPDAVRTAQLEPLLDATLSVESVGVFKPSPRVYQLATERFGLPAPRIAFLSSNPWDAFGAHAFGFRVFWVNRAGQPDEYGLRGAVSELRDLSGLPAALS